MAYILRFCRELLHVDISLLSRHLGNSTNQKQPNRTQGPWRFKKKENYSPQMFIVGLKVRFEISWTMV